MTKRQDVAIDDNTPTKKPSFFRVLNIINVLILIVSFTMVGTLFTSYYQSQTKEAFIKSTQTSIEQNRLLIEYISDTVVNLSRQVFRNQKFNRLITTEFTAEMPRYEARTEAVKILEPQQQAFDHIESLVFIGDDGFSIGAPVNKFLDVKEKEFTDPSFIDLAWENKSSYIWLPPQSHPIYSPDEPVIAVLKSFQNFITLENSGVLVINLDPDIFNEAIDHLRFDESGFMFIADKSGAVIAQPSPDDLELPEGLLNHVIGDTLKESIKLPENRITELSNFETLYNGRNYFISYSQLEQTQWFSIAIIETSAFTKGTTRLIQYMIIIIGFAILASFFISIRFSHWLFKPILHLSNTMKVYESGDYTARIHDSYKYEFEILRENFNNMADRINDDFTRINVQMETITNYSNDLEISKAELNTFNQELELRVEDRTRALSQMNEYLEVSLAKNQETQAELIVTKSELEDSLEELKETQDKLIQTEKNAALGQLLAGISHEINTPLGTALTTVTYLESMQRELHQLYEDKRLSRKDLHGFITDSNDMTRLIIDTLHKTIGILNRFKEISILQAEKDVNVFSLNERLSSIIAVYRERNSQVHFNIHYSHEIQIKAPRGLIQEIFETLIDNAYLHGFSDSLGEDPHICIDLKAQNNDLLILFSDNGVGLEEDQVNRVFEPFYTTKFGSGGSGLGLHLLYNIISTALQGRVDIVDLEGYSLSFKILIPNIIHDLK